MILVTMFMVAVVALIALRTVWGRHQRRRRADSPTGLGEHLARGHRKQHTGLSPPFSGESATPLQRQSEPSRRKARTRSHGTTGDR
jgi:hypothetical protein